MSYCSRYCQIFLATVPISWVIKPLGSASLIIIRRASIIERSQKESGRWVILAAELIFHSDLVRSNGFPEGQAFFLDLYDGD